MTATGEEVRTGGCHCGATRYEIRGAPLSLYACHCRECQKQSGSAHGLSMIFPRAALTVTQGAPARWTRPTDSGATLDCVFCPDCGARLWHEPSRTPDQLSVKAGGLDQPVDLTGARHIWVSRKLAGVLIPPDAEQWPEEPPD